MTAVRLKDAIARFIVHCRVARGLSPHSLRAYTADLADFEAHVRLRRRRSPLVTAIDREALRRYAANLADRGLNPSTIRRRMATLKVLFRWLEREEAIGLTPFHRMDLAIRIPRRLPKALAAEDMRRLLARTDAEVRQPGGHDAVLMHFVVAALFATGLRVGELVGLRLEDVDRAQGAIHVRGKGNRERRVHLLGKSASVVLKRYLEIRERVGGKSTALLVDKSGIQSAAQTVRRRLVALAARAGVARRVTPHMLRHTAATQLIEAGVDISHVQKLLGHASIATTQIYTHVSDRSLREEILRADTLRRVRRADN